MTGQELATAVQYGANVVFLVVNNGLYGTIRMYQEREYPDRYPATELRNPDFAAYARAFGGFGATIEKTEEFPAAFKAAQESGKHLIAAYGLAAGEKVRPGEGIVETPGTADHDPVDGQLHSGIVLKLQAATGLALSTHLLQLVRQLRRVLLEIDQQASFAPAKALEHELDAHRRFSGAGGTGEERGAPCRREGDPRPGQSAARRRTDAGFVATFASGPGGRNNTNLEAEKQTHRTIALTSIGVATASYLIMLFGNFAAAGFQTASDGGAGTLVTYQPPVVSVALLAAH
jgi:hypothetical protein